MLVRILFALLSIISISADTAECGKGLKAGLKELEWNWGYRVSRADVQFRKQLTFAIERKLRNILAHREPVSGNCRGESSGYNFVR